MESVHFKIWRGGIRIMIIIILKPFFTEQKKWLTITNTTANKNMRAVVFAIVSHSSPRKTTLWR